MADNELPDKFDRMQQRIATDSKEVRSSYATNRLLNPQGVAEGPNTPPVVVQGLRVQAPQAFEVISRVNLKGRTQFVLSWLSNVQMDKWNPTYTIYTYAQQNFVNWHGQSPNSPLNQGPLQEPISTQSAPIGITVWGDTAQRVVFNMQVRLSNGLISDPNDMPSCAGTCDPMARYVTQATATFNCGPYDEVVLCDPAAGAFTVTLLSVELLPLGFLYIIRNINTGAGNITVQGATGAQTINGAATLTLNAGTPTGRLVSDRSVWWST